VSSLKLQEQGSRYLFIVLSVWLEKMLTRGDYRRADGGQTLPAGAPSPLPDPTASDSPART
jgi:hypothetical protein